MVTFEAKVRVCEEFFNYYRSTSTFGTSLQSYISQWLTDEDGVVFEASEGDFDTFLGGVAMVLARVADNPVLLHIHSRTLTGRGPFNSPVSQVFSCFRAGDDAHIRLWPS